MSEATHITPEPHDSQNMKWIMTTATDVLVLEGKVHEPKIYTLKHNKLKNAGSRRKLSPRKGKTIDYLTLMGQT